MYYPSVLLASVIAEKNVGNCSLLIPIMIPDVLPKYHKLDDSLTKAIIDSYG